MTSNSSKIPTDAALDAVQIIMFLMRDHPHQLVISGEATEEMRGIYEKVLEANDGIWPAAASIDKP